MLFCLSCHVRTQFPCWPVQQRGHEDQGVHNRQRLKYCVFTHNRKIWITTEMCHFYNRATRCWTQPTMNKSASILFGSQQWRCPLAARQLHVAAAFDRRDRQTDGHRTVTGTLTARSGQSFRASATYGRRYHGLLCFVVLSKWSSHFRNDGEQFTIASYTDGRQ